MSASYHPPASFPPQDQTQRSALLDWIEKTPLVYGPWQDFKRGFKTLENAYVGGSNEVELLGATLARVDAHEFPEHRKAPSGTTQPPPLLPGGIYSLSEGEGVIYAGTETGLQVFDAASLLEPKALPIAKNKVSYNSQFTRVGHYLLENSGALYDIQNPREPKFVVRGEFAGTNFCALDNEHIASYDQWRGFTIYQLSTGTQTAITAVGNITGGVQSCVAAGGRAVVALKADIYNYRAPVKMRLVGLADFSAPHMGVEFGDANETPVSLHDSTLVTFNKSQINVYDINSAKPRRLGSLNIPDLNSVAVHGDLAIAFTYRYDYRTGVQQSLMFVDLSKPHDPRKVGELAGFFAPQSVRLGTVLWAGTRDGLRILDISDPARAQLIGQKPSAATFGYLKRRGRRLLRVLAEGDEAAYLRLASEVLGRTPGDALDFTTQWIEADILVGAGRVWEQTRHGRGPIVRRAKFWRRQRLERAPEAWDTHLDTARELAARETLPWQTRVTMHRILRVNGQTPPPLSPAALEAILWGDWAFAALEAAREAQTRLSELSPRAVAALLWNINPRRRSQVLEQVTRAGQNGRISAATGSGLAALLGRDAAAHASTTPGVAASLTRRAREIALLLAARCDLSDRNFDGTGALAALPLLLGASEAPLRSLGLDLCRRLAPEQALEVVLMLPRIAAPLRESFIEALAVSAAKGKFEAETLAKCVRHDNTEVRAAMWRLIAASKTSNSVLRDLWTGLLRSLSLAYDYNTRAYSWNISSFLQTAINTPAALDVLARGGANKNEVLRFTPRFWAQPLAPAPLFAAYALFTPVPEWIQALEIAPDEVWNLWKGPWLGAISRHPRVLTEFWQTVQSELEGSKLDAGLSSRLRARTFQDAEVAATFAGAAGSLPPALLLQLIGAVPDEVWSIWRTALLQTLQSDAATRAAFWDAARTLGLGSELLRVRLVDDAEMAATFGLLESDALDFDDPALETLLLNWVEARREALSGDDLVRAGVHPLPAIRAWGLEQLQARGLNVPLALRLLESGLPDAIAAGRIWFETTDGNPVDLALALCDSPQLETREYGRVFLAARLESLLAAGLLARLQENPNAEMQSFVADLLLQRPAATVGHDGTTDPAREFDRAVLRGRYRARKAKNLVQQRRAGANAKALPDDQTLLELARGRTPRDADWAFTQLAKRALEGNVENVEVSGVGGI